MEKQYYEIYFNGDLSRYYEYALLEKNNGWKVIISYCTPEKSGTEEISLIINMQSKEDINAYIDKLSKIFSNYVGKALCCHIEEIKYQIQAIDKLL